MIKKLAFCANILLMLIFCKASRAAEQPSVEGSKLRSYSNLMLSAIQKPKNLTSLGLGFLAGWAVYAYMSRPEVENRDPLDRMQERPTRRSFKIDKKSARASARLKFVPLGIDLQYNPEARENFAETYALLQDFCIRRNVVNKESLLAAFTSLHESVKSSIDIVNDIKDIAQEEEQPNHPVVLLADGIYQDEEKNPDIDAIDLTAFDSDTQEILTGYLNLLLIARRNREISFQLITQFDAKCSSARAKKSPKMRVSSQTFKNKEG